ncbi:hypothetical protein RHOSPDRAFT_34479 [Rhodotorula sp. JG-1b]|nr:hypothetical protein RHOSPDRAFT_34479 [Rhodotorula sp. JG-1b]
MSSEQDTPGASAAALACLSDEVVGRIVVFVRHIHASDPDLGHMQRIEATYKALSQLSLVAPTFRKAAQRELDRVLLFRTGAQVKNWLDYAGKRRPRHPTRRLVLYDRLPFREGGRPSCKWSHADLQSLFNTVVGVKAISILFFCQVALPVDLLTGPRLSGVVSLELASPLTGKLSRPMYAKLERLAIIDDHPAMNRDWSATFRALASSRAASTLRILGLDHLPQASTHMLALVPMAPQCWQLELPVLDPNDPQKWRLWVFARLCDSLQYLNVLGFQGDAINVLLAFPTGPPCLYIEELVGTVGYGHPLVDESVIPVKDAIHALISVLLQKALSGQPVRHLAIWSRRNMSDRHQVNLMGLVGSAGLYRLELGERDEYLTQEECDILAGYIANSKRKNRVGWTQTLHELEVVE